MVTSLFVECTSNFHYISCFMIGAVNEGYPVDPAGDIVYVEQFTSPPGPPASLEFLELWNW